MLVHSLKETHRNDPLSLTIFVSPLSKLLLIKEKKSLFPLLVRARSSAWMGISCDDDDQDDAREWKVARRRRRQESRKYAQLAPTRPNEQFQRTLLEITSELLREKRVVLWRFFFCLFFFIFRGKVRLRRRRRSEFFLYFVLLCPSLLTCYIRRMKWSMQHCVGSSTCELHRILYSFRNRPSASLSIQQISSARLIHS